LSSGIATFLDPLGNVAIDGAALLPPVVVAGTDGIEAMMVILQHNGDPGESSSMSSAVTLRILDQGGQGLLPDGIFNRIVVETGGDTLAAEYITADHTSNVYLPFSQPILTAPGEGDTIGVLIDLEPSAESGFFQIHVNETGLDITDATDGSDNIDLIGEFPLTSGMSSIVLPVEDAEFKADAELPDNIISGEEVTVFDLHFKRNDGFNGSFVRVQSLVLDVLDGDDELTDPIDVIETIRFENDTDEIAVTFEVQDGRLHVVFVDTVAFDAAEDLHVAMRIQTTEQPQVPMFSIRINESPDVSCIDQTSGGSVTVHPVAGTDFPYNSGRASFMVRDLQRSFVNYPNPFVVGSEKTKIAFYMPGDGTVTMRVFTVTGRLVKTLLNSDFRRTGSHEDVFWDGRNGEGDTVINGVYYLLLEATVGGREHVFKRKVSALR
jgi:hypothetical protein